MLTHRVSGAPGGWSELDDDLSKRRRPLDASRWLRRELARSLGTSPDSRALAAYVALNLAQATIQLAWGFATSRVRLISEAFHLLFSSFILAAGLYALRHARAPPDERLTYGGSRLPVLAAFANACFLLFVALSLAVEGLHALIDSDPSHHTSALRAALLNCAVDVVGVASFRRNASPSTSTSTSASASTPWTRAPEDILMRGVLIHAISQVVRSSRVVLALVLRRVARVPNPEALASFFAAGVVVAASTPSLRDAARVLSQAPPDDSRAALAACRSETSALPGVIACEDVRVWVMAPGEAVGTVVLRVERGADREAVARETRRAYERGLGARAHLTVELRER